MQPIQKKNKISSVDNVNNRIVLSEEYFNKIKNTIKITGSLFSEIMLENNNYSKTNFQIWLEKFKLIIVDKISSASLITGTLFEKKIVEYLQIFFNCSFKTYDAKTIFNFFDENKIFDGVPDCEPINDKNKFLYKDGFPLIEIKTISLDKLCYNEDEFGNKKMFRNLNNEPLIKIPKFNAKSFVRENAKKTLDEKIRKYALQLSFYMYLRKIDLGIETINGAIAIAFIEKDEYIFDENDIECINKINLFTKRINENKKINFDSSKNSNHNYVNKIELIYAKLDEKNILSYSFCGKEFEINIEEKIEKCREWYFENLLNINSPELNNADYIFLENAKKILDYEEK